MAVRSGVLCSSTHTANYELLIMMPSDNYYMNQDGVVHHDYLCFIRSSLKTGPARAGHVQIAVDITAVDIDLFFLYCTGTIIMYDSFSL